MPNAFTQGYALLVGVGESAYPAWSLPVTVKDIQAILYRPARNSMRSALTAAGRSC
jgi:hypothetical protein